MKKDFDIFNDIEIDLGEFEEIELSELEKKRMINKAIRRVNGKKSKKKILTAVVASIAMISVLVLGNEGVYAKILSDVESFFNKSSEELEPYKIDHSNVAFKSLEEYGLKVNISDVILDDMYLLLKINIDWSDVDLDKYGLTEEERESIQFSSLGEFKLFSGDKVISKKRSIYSDTVEGNKRTQSIRVEYKPDDIDLSKKSKVKLIFDDIVINVKNKNQPYQHTSGEWHFEIDIDGKELEKNLSIIDINNKQSFENEFYKGNIEVKQYRESPISKKIILRKTESHDNSPWYWMSTKFYDENNNEIEHNWVADNDERTILEIKDNKKYKKIKVINKIIETDGNMNFKRVVHQLEPVIINLTE